MAKKDKKETKDAKKEKAEKQDAATEIKIKTFTRKQAARLRTKAEASVQAKVEAAAEAQKTVTEQKSKPKSTGATDIKRATNAGKSKADGTWGIYPKSISRIETLKYAGWFVRVFYNGASMQKTFGDNVYGGKDNALQEALAWRDVTEEQMGKPRTDRSVRKKETPPGEETGIHRRTVKHMKRGKTYFRDIVEVTWTSQAGKVSRTTISVRKYGEEKALKMAREIRREKEAEFFGKTVS